MAWEIAAVGATKVGAGILKSKVTLIAAGAVAAAVGVYAMNKDKADVALSTPYPDGGSLEETGSIGAGSGDGRQVMDDILNATKALITDSDATQVAEFSRLTEVQARLTAEIGSELGNMINENARRFEAMQAGTLDRFSSLDTTIKGLNDTLSNQGNAITGYARQLGDIQQQSGVLQKQVENILSTPSFYYDPQYGYTYNPVQVAGMSAWATAEQAALSRGYAGSSLNPVGTDGLTVTYHPTGHVSFSPSGSPAPSTPSAPASGPAGDIARATSSSNLAASNSRVSAITGGSGSIESQLSGMSASQKLSTLRSAGLIS